MLKQVNPNIYRFEESSRFPTIVFTGEGSFHINDSLSDECSLGCHSCPSGELPTSSREIADVS